ncbi:MAG: hypothetical protein ABSG57_01555 [Candidatus Bathyarchaeia archaeon]
MFVKKDENSWSGETEEEAVNSLFAIAVLTCLHGSLDVGYTRHLEDLVNKVEKRWSSDRQFLMPYLLGLYAIFEQFDDQREQVHVRLESVLAKAESETKRLSFAVEYLFSLAFFYDLVDPPPGDNTLSDIRARASQVAVTASNQFQNIGSTQTKIKLLYSLAALRLNEPLKSLYDSTKAEIEKLSDTAESEDIKALLLRPYITLSVHCNRRIVFGIVDYFKKEGYGIEERKLRQRLSSFFLYMDAKRTPDIEIEKMKDNYRLSLTLSEDSVVTLQRQPSSVAFISTIALSLCNCGFKRIYTVPAHEIEQYQEFKRSKEADKYTRVDKVGLFDLINSAIIEKYYISVVKGLVPFASSVIVAIVVFLAYNTFLSVLAPIVELILLEIIGMVVPKISESGYALVSTVFRKSDRVKLIRKEIEKMLDRGETSVS